MKMIFIDFNSIIVLHIKNKSKSKTGNLLSISNPNINGDRSIKIGDNYSSHVNVITSNIITEAYLDNTRVTLRNMMNVFVHIWKNKKNINGDILYNIFTFLRRDTIDIHHLLVKN